MMLKICKRKAVVFGAFLIGALLIILPAGSLGTIPIDDRSSIIHVPGDYPTIQEGIDAASPGDTVLVEPGWYEEHIYYNKFIYLVGRLGPEYTTISAPAWPRTSVIHCWGGGGSIEGFTIRDGYGYFNGDANYGAGILCYSNTLVIRNNIITANRNAYGAISSFQSATIENNVIVDNLCNGISYYFWAEPQIINNIIANNGYAIVFEEGTDENSYIAYNDLWNNGCYGCVPDEGNIEANPRFVNSPKKNYHLHSNSPCIDAGHPNSTLDPDGTRADIGAFYFNQSTTPSIELYPHNQPITIPSQGGSVEYDGWVYNLDDTPVTVDIWSYVILPSLQQYGPFRLFLNTTVRPHVRIGVNNIRESVPMFAPSGVYTYIGFVGDFETQTILDQSLFNFTKS